VDSNGLANSRFRGDRAVPSIKKPKSKKVSERSSKKSAQRKSSFAPEEILFTTVYSGPGGRRSSGNGVIHTLAELNQAFPDFPFGSMVDLNKYDLIYVALGARPTSGYKAEITEVMHITDRSGILSRPPTNEVAYREIPDRPPTRDQIVYPMHLIKLQKLYGSVSFNNITRARV
jgi:hypothetical protein